MRVEIVQGGKVLRQVHHDGRIFVEAPPEGDYIIRLTNNTWANRRMAVVSVDGINVLDGKEASLGGSGYVLRGGESIDIKGWRRSDTKVASFTFKPTDESYSAQVGKGTSNVGVIGVAVFDEKVEPVFRTPFHGFGSTTLDSMPIATNGGGPRLSASAGTTYGARGTQGRLRRKSVKKSTESLDVGTGYGKEATMYTQATTFERASDHPVMTLSYQYATRERLKEWGVPVAPPQPNPFPADEASVPAPPGWRG